MMHRLLILALGAMVALGACAESQRARDVTAIVGILAESHLVHDELANEIVGIPATVVPDIQIAIADAEQFNPTLDTVSSVGPQALVVSNLTGLVTGNPAFVAEAHAKIKLAEGGTGDLFATAVLRPVGGKYVSSSIESWHRSSVC